MANDLVALIKSKKQKIAQLQAELDEAMRELDDASSVERTRTPQATPARRGRRSRLGAAKRNVKKRKRRTDTTTAWSEVLIRDAGGALHIDELIKGIDQRFHKRVKKPTLVGNLSRKVKNKDTFYRAAPSTYGLLDMPKERQLKFGG